MRSRIRTPLRRTPLALASFVLCLCLNASAGDDDTDSDGVQDLYDNCTRVANSTQMDADEDGYGNACDFDTNNDGAVGTDDFGDLIGALGTTDALYDFNGDGAVGTDDVSDFVLQLGGIPGPSGLPCAGTIPCIASDPPSTDTDTDDDADADGLLDIFDNCVDVANPEQMDADSDGYGNACDFDTNNDGAVGADDLSDLFTALGTTDALYDFNGDGAVGSDDLGDCLQRLGTLPGPSGLSCAGTIPCVGGDPDRCDPLDPDSNLIADDADCDGIVTEEDCNDNDIDLNHCLVDISVGLHDTCGLLDDDTIRCFEDDSHPPPSGTFTQVDVGFFASCAVDTDGAATCWGENVEDWDWTDAPQQTFETLDVGVGYACGIRTDGQLECWGDDGWVSSYELDDVPSGQFERVAAAQTWACAINTAGRIVCWGDLPFRIDAPSGTFQSISAEGNQACAVRTNGQVTCWGDWSGASTPGELQTGSYTSVSVQSHQHMANVCAVTTSGAVRCGHHPEFYRPSLTVPEGPFEAVSVGRGKACGVHTDGEVVCWGGSLPIRSVEQVHALENLTCHLDGDGLATCFGDLSPLGTWLSILSQTRGWKSLAVSNEQICGLKAGNLLDCKDPDWIMQRGGPHTPFNTSDFESVHGGSEAQVCGLGWDGEIDCWGFRYDGEEPPAGPFAQLDVGRNHRCAVRPDGSVACWGDDSFGKSTPPAGAFLSVSAGADGTCGLQLDGTAVCWGDVEGDVPSTYFETVETGDGWACGIRPDGTVQCWGANADGQADPPRDAFVSLTTGEAHTCGVLRAGGFVCWGDNTYGQLVP